MSEISGLFTIGEFSRITGITVKSLRYYHDEKVLIPSFVDPQTGYRYYAATMIERARAIVYLRQCDFSINEIRDLLADANDERILQALERQKAVIAERIRALRRAARSLDQFIAEQNRGRNMRDDGDVKEKDLDPILIAGIRMRGHYAECGKGFGKIGRAFGRVIAGPAMLLHYDDEYKEEDADFEACMPVKRAKNVDDISVRELSATRCVSLIHKGPYDQMGPSYAIVLKYVKEHGYSILMPTREVYLKGPGLIFKGNPANYMTEIQIPFHIPATPE